MNTKSIETVFVNQQNRKPESAEKLRHPRCLTTLPTNIDLILKLFAAQEN
jgi:hypothetical protein